VDRKVAYFCRIPFVPLVAYISSVINVKELLLFFAIEATKLGFCSFVWDLAIDKFLCRPMFFFCVSGACRPTILFLRWQLASPVQSLTYVLTFPLSISLSAWKSSPK